MTNTILVLGATGNVGSQVVKGLVEAGANVRAAVRSLQKAAALKSDKVSLAEFDTEKPETFDTTFADVEKVFLITTLIPNLVEVQTNLVAAAKKAGVKHIVKLSGMGAEIEPGVTMTRWHRAVEKAIEASGMSYTFVRPNGFMQNYSNFSGQTIKAQNAFYLPMGDGKVSHIDVRDIASVAAVALTQDGHAGKAYEVTGPTAISNAEIAEIISTVVGRKIDSVDVPEDTARQEMQKSGMPDSLVDANLELYGIYKAGYAAEVTSVVEQVTGKKAISFEQFAQDSVAAFK
ncbi:MAG: SDR family oxidoreductase [Nostocaceae cyanobacterium]|nr:SDR family oxidoreductase [Nostocaceae cyanobacterium]